MVVVVVKDDELPRLEVEVEGGRGVVGLQGEDRMLA